MKDVKKSTQKMFTESWNEALDSIKKIPCFDNLKGSEVLQAQANWIELYKIAQAATTKSEIETESKPWKYDPYSGVPMIWKKKNLTTEVLDVVFHSLSPEEQLHVFMQGEDIIKFASRKAQNEHQ